MPQYFTDDRGQVRPLTDGSGQLPVVFNSQKAKETTEEKERFSTRLKGHVADKIKKIQAKRLESEQKNEVAKTEQIKIISNEIDEATDSNNGSNEERYKSLQAFAIENRKSISEENIKVINRVLGVLDVRRRMDSVRDNPPTEKEHVKQPVPQFTQTEPVKEPEKPIETKTEKKESVEDKTNVAIING